jgi:hypothetical protein
MIARGSNRPIPPKKPTHSVLSGMGGSFDVRIIADEGGDDVLVRVCMPRNPDWHGYEFGIARSKLQSIAA